MKSINMILMKAKLKHYKNIKRERESEGGREGGREQKQDLDLKNQASKCMGNTSFYKLKFGTID
jgi:hypothetical protein